MKKSFVFSLVSGSIFMSMANAGTLYSTLPSPIPIDTTFSLGYRAAQTSQFGDLISTLGGTLNQGTVLLSNWAYESAFEPFGSSTGYTVPVTLTLYSVGAGNSVGSVLTARTSDVFVPWRPEPTSGPCATQNAVDDPSNQGNPYQAGSGNCYSGAAVEAFFSFDNFNLDPGALIYGVSFATPDSSPTDKLNLAWTTDDPSVGTNPLPDTGYINTTLASVYADHGAGGTGTFRQDTNYSCANNQICGAGNFSAVIELAEVPEPGTISMMLIALAGIVSVKFCRTRSV